MPTSKANRDYKKEYLQRKERERTVLGYAGNKAKNENKRAKRQALKYALYGNTLQHFEFAINHRHGPFDGSKTPPGFQAEISQMHSWNEPKVNENTPKNDQNL